MTVGQQTNDVSERVLITGDLQVVSPPMISIVCQMLSWPVLPVFRISPEFRILQSSCTNFRISDFPFNSPGHAGHFGG